jgi:hypothetical protein
MPGLVSAAVVSLVLLFRDIISPSTVKILDIGTAILFGSGRLCQVHDGDLVDRRSSSALRSHGRLDFGSQWRLSAGETPSEISRNSILPTPKLISQFILFPGRFFPRSKNGPFAVVRWRCSTEE